nr:GHKL domain-containing protein [Faecalibaculum rodentium]
MLKPRSRILMTLFFLSELLMLAASAILVHRQAQAQPVILALFVLCLFLGLALVRSMMTGLQRNAARQAQEKLRDMEIEQLAALVGARQDVDSLRSTLTASCRIPEDLEEEIPSLYVSRCANPVVDAILFRKSREMKEQNIPCRLRASLPEKLDLDPAILLSLFSNLLDNAAQAAVQCPIHCRYVVLEAILHRNCLICTCENSVTEKAALTPGVSSRGTPGHGHGLQILEDLCRSHGGQLSGSVAEGRCRLQATLWIGDRS